MNNAASAHTDLVAVGDVTLARREMRADKTKAARVSVCVYVRLCAKK